MRDQGERVIAHPNGKSVCLRVLSHQESKGQHSKGTIANLSAKITIHVLVICADLAGDWGSNCETRPHSLATLSFKEVTGPESDHKIVYIAIDRRHTLRQIKVELNFSVLRSKFHNFPGEVDLHRFFDERRRCHLNFNGVSDLEFANTITSFVALIADLIVGDCFGNSQSNTTRCQLLHLWHFHRRVEANRS